MSTISPSKDPYAAITEDLTYSYEGIFSSQSVAAAVDAADQDNDREFLLLQQVILHIKQGRTQLRHFLLEGFFVNFVTEFC